MHSRLLITLILICLSTLTSVSPAGNNDATRPPASRLIIYEIVLRDFTGTPGKALGDGTVAGMMQDVAALKNHGGTPIDYLTRLGINAILFTPTDACGSSDDYKALINAAHERSITVIINFPSVNNDSHATIDSWVTDFGADGVSITADNNLSESLYTRLTENHPDIYFINRGADTNDSYGIIGMTNLNEASCRYVSGLLDDASLDSFYSISDNARTVSYAESHDAERVAYRANIDGVSGVKGSDTSSATNRLRRLGSLAAQMLLCPGPHMIRQFEELGADQISLNADGTPNQAPKTVVWNNINNALYRGLHDTYSDLCNIRRQYPEMFDGSARCLTSLSSATGRYISLSSDNTEMYIVVNPAVNNTAVICPINAETGERVDLSASGFRLLTATGNVSPTVSTSGVSLPGGAFAVYARERESAINSISADTHPTNQIDIIDGVITPRGSYNTLTIRTVAGIAVPTDTRLTPGIYIVTVDDSTNKIIVR